jgi:hypothetical protein
MKDLKQIVKEFKTKISNKNHNYNNNNSNSWITYESISGFDLIGNYFSVYFTESVKNLITIEITHTTKCIDYVLNIIKKIEPKSTVISYKSTVTHTEIIN